MKTRAFVLYLLFITIPFLTISVYAQTGSIKGRVTELIDGKTEPVIGAIVSVEGTSNGITTDTAGHFFLEKIPVGIYNVKLSYIGYKPKIVKGVEVKEGQTAALSNIRIEEDVTTTQEVEIIGTREKGTDASVITEIKKLDMVVSGISNEAIRRTLDRDAADVAKRIAGVSVAEDRFIIVRGLAERYNAVMLNDVLTPSYEQDVKSFSLDNITSKYIDRMLVFKSPSADLPGDFAGGVVKIYTTGMPVKNNFNINFSSSARQGTTGKDFKIMPQGKDAWLGYDDGTNSYPSGLPPDYNSASGLKYDAYKIGSLFRNDTWSPKMIKANPDMRFNINGAYRLKLGGGKVLGIVSGVNYSNTYQRWNDASQSLFQGTANAGLKVEDSRRTVQLKSVDNIINNIKTVRLNILQNFILQLNNKNTIEFKNMYTHSGTNSYRNAFYYTVNNDVNKDFYSKPENNSYTSDVNVSNTYGGIVTSQLAGKHTILNNTDFNWIIGYASAQRDEPDFKNYRYTFSKNGYGYLLTPSSPTMINFGRAFYKTEEHIKTASGDITHKRIFDMLGETQLSFKSGFYLEDKNRAFAAKPFAYTPHIQSPSTQLPYYNDVDMSKISPEDLNKDETWNNYNGLVIYPDGGYGSYTAQTTLYAFYGMAKVNWRDKINVTGGMRLENFTRIIRGRQSFVQNWLPSVNLSYNFSKKILIRGSYGKTVNRPELREAADLQTFDFYQRTRIVGNAKLKQTDVNNYDFRIEYYPSPDEAISVGVFYKDFTNPIERTLLPLGLYDGLDDFEINYLNANKAYSKGVELETRKSLRNLLLIKGKDILGNLSLVVNAALISSKLKYDSAQLANSGVQGIDQSKPGANKLGLKDFLADNGNRGLFYQSPYMLNIGMTYASEKSKTMVNVSYNVLGSRLTFVIPGYGSIYEVPRHVLDLTIAQQVGKYIEVRLGIQDIINQKVQFIQDINNDGKVRRLSGTGYQNDPSQSNYINNQRGTAVPVIPQQGGIIPHIPGDTQYLGYNRGRYFTLGLALRF